jgi:murein DD-endopeptidase MepM/ murein hydrolase activator NlpD
LAGLLAVVVACAMLLPSVAAAKTAAQLEAELAALKSQTRNAGIAYDHAYRILDDTQGQIMVVDRRLRRTQAKLVVARRNLNKQAASVYRRGDFALLEFLIGSASFEQFVTRLDFLRRAGAEEAHTVIDVKQLRSELNSERSSLLAEKRTEKVAVVNMRAQGARLQVQLKAKQGDFLRVKAQLDALRGGSNRPAGQMGVPGPNGMVFPVRGSYYYSDTWGAARSGGRHHEGTDIMSPRGTPVVAVLSGRVSSSNHGLGGKSIWEYADNGWQFYYAHLDGWAVTSGHVRAGQVIGYVGNTGNAAGGPCHLHFQIMPHGSPVDPYPYLRAME